MKMLKKYYHKDVMLFIDEYDLPFRHALLYDFNDEFKKEYGGYKIGNQEIYNPYSIVCYVDNGEFGRGWAYNASVNKLRNAFLEVMKYDNHLEEDFEKMIIEGKVEVIVDFNTFYYERPCAKTLWGFAVNSGYLTVEEVISKEEHKYCLKIPNAETRREIAKILEKYLSDDNFLSIIWRLVNEDQNHFLTYY